MEPSAYPPKPAAQKAGRLPLLRKAFPGRRPPGGQPSAEGSAAGRKSALVSLSWAEQDIENRWGVFKGGRYTSVNKLLSFLLALVLSALFLGLMVVLHRQTNPFLNRLGECFVRPGNIFATGPATVCFFWGVVIVAIKVPKLRLQRRALELAAVPQHREFVLNESTAKTVLERMRSLVDNTSDFILLNRIDRALSSLHNIGGVSDVSTILKSQADNDENQVASSYAITSAMIWAIPVLGFVGTVLGLSIAIGKFTDALSSSAGVDQIKTRLQEVTAGLSTAFETTLVGLVFALILYLVSDLMQQNETDFLDECNDYCHAHVVSKLRVRQNTEG